METAPQHHHRQDETVYHQHIPYPSPIFPCRFLNLAKKRSEIRTWFLMGTQWLRSDRLPSFYSLCSPYMNKNFPRKSFSLLGQDRRDQRPTRNDSVIYSERRLREKDQENGLNILQLHKHHELKTPTCLLHNIYEVILRTMYV